MVRVAWKKIYDSNAGIMAERLKIEDTLQIGEWTTSFYYSKLARPQKEIDIPA